MVWVRKTALDAAIAGLASVAGCLVVSKVPPDRPGLFVRVEQGAPRSFGPSQDATLLICQVYGEDLDEVIEVIYRCRDYLRFSCGGAASEVLGYREETGPVEFPDPDIAHVFRWQMTGKLFTDLR